LTERERGAELKTLDEIKSLAATLKQLVEFLTKERSSKDEAIKSILLANHPGFRRFAELTKTPYRVFFANKRELDSWLQARGWTPTPSDRMYADSKYEWTNSKSDQYIKLKKDIFDGDGSPKAYTAENWKDSWVSVEEMVPEPPEIDEDDIPF
jgi:hypothetical protein